MKKIKITVALVLCINLIHAQNPLLKQWDKRYGGTAYEELTCFIETHDGGFLVGGNSLSGIGGDKTQANWDTLCIPNCTFDFWIIKTDSIGNKQWDKNFGGTNGDFLRSLQQTFDGGYILGGASFSGIGGNKSQSNWDTLCIPYCTTDYWIIKIDSMGNQQWDKDFGGAGDDAIGSIRQTSDGGYILGGYSNSSISGDKTQDTIGGFDFWIVKTDSLGIKQWDKDFGGIDWDFILSLQQTSDGGYIFGGTSASGISGDKTQPTWGYRDYWIVKTDSLGIKQWDKDFGGSDDDNCYSLQLTSDGGFILGGKSTSGVSGDKTQPIWDTCLTCPQRGDFWIVKIDSFGNKQWDKDFGAAKAEDEFGNIYPTSDGGYLIGGTSYSNISGDKTENNLGREQSWFVKTDSTGNKQWDKTLHTNIGNDDDETGLVVQTKDGCYAMANWTFGDIGGDKSQPTQGSTDYWIIKFCDTTSTTSINQLPNFHFQFSIYPNPTNAILNLFLNNKEKIVITNLIGEILMEKIALGKVALDVSFLSAGIYFIKVDNEVKKFVKE